MRKKFCSAILSIMFLALRHSNIETISQDFSSLNTLSFGCTTDLSTSMPTFSLAIAAGTKMVFDR